MSGAHFAYRYANHLCAFLDRAWACSLCGKYNEYANIRNRRYRATFAIEFSMVIACIDIHVRCNPTHRVIVKE